MGNQLRSNGSLFLIESESLAYDSTTHQLTFMRNVSSRRQFQYLSIELINTSRECSEKVLFFFFPIEMYVYEEGVGDL